MAGMFSPLIYEAAVIPISASRAFMRAMAALASTSITTPPAGSGICAGWSTGVAPQSPSNWLAALPSMDPVEVARTMLSPAPKVIPPLAVIIPVNVEVLEAVKTPVEVRVPFEVEFPPLKVKVFVNVPATEV